MFAGVENNNKQVGYVLCFVFYYIFSTNYNSNPLRSNNKTKVCSNYTVGGLHI